MIFGGFVHCNYRSAIFTLRRHDAANGGVGRVWFVILLLRQGMFFMVTGYFDFKGDQHQSYHHVIPNDCHKIEQCLFP